MERPTLTRKTLLNYSIADKEGITECTVAATIRPNHLINDNEPYYIVYLRVLTQENLDILLEKLDDIPIIDFYENRELFLTGILFQNQIKEGFDFPTKGDKVKVHFEFKDDKLTIKNIDLFPRYELRRLDIEEVYPLVKLFKTYLNDKFNNIEESPSLEGDSIPEL